MIYNMGQLVPLNKQNLMFTKTERKNIMKKISQKNRNNIHLNSLVIGGSGEPLKLQGFSVEDFMPEYAPLYAELSYKPNKDGSGIIFMSYNHPDNPLFYAPVLEDENGYYIELCNDGHKERFMCVQEKGFDLSKFKNSVSFVYRTFRNERFAVYHQSSL